MTHLKIPDRMLALALPLALLAGGATVAAQPSPEERAARASATEAA